MAPRLGAQTGKVEKPLSNRHPPAAIASNRGDQLIFDLDPSAEDGALLRDAAKALRDLLEDIGVSAYVKTTGSSGLHIVTPLQRRAGFDEVRQFAQDAALLVSRQYPEEFTTEIRKEKRQGRLFLDTTRNAYAQTVVAPYGPNREPKWPHLWIGMRS